MSILAPLYLIGALAIGLPILFHLIRRRPTGAIEFSSLMFLQPTPPRLTRRSRLENWPLLLMRALALLLLAAAFARPFLRQTESASSDTVGQQIVIALDQSASMQRTDVWKRAVDDVRFIINELDSKDQVAIVAFDEQPHVRFSLEQSAELNAAQRKQAALSAVDDISPTWLATDMGRAISYAADLVSQYEADDAAMQTQSEDAASMLGNASVVLVSDLQQGGQIESLQQFAWPKKLSLEIHRIDPQSPTNASAQILSDGQFSQDPDRIRVRVSNASDSQAARFQVSFGEHNESANAISPADSSELPVQVPPGESRVVRMPIPSSTATSVNLRGDEQTFDNQRFIVGRQPESLTLLFVGPEVPKSSDTTAAEDSPARQSLLYYLQRVPLSSKRGDVSVTQLDASELTVVPSPVTTPLIVVAEAISTDVADRLKQYVNEGGRVLFVLSKPELKSLRQGIVTVTGSDAESFAISESTVKDYAMLSGINFAHPVFQPMSDPQFNDFTKVRFWSHRTLQNVPDNWATLAQFDDGDPALLEYQTNEARVWVLAAGWQPAASQLALSTKFLPLIYSFFGGISGDVDQYASTVVGQAAPFRFTDTATVTGPDENQFAYQRSDDAMQIDRPGIYRYSDGETMKKFAVNLAASESETTPLENEAFERFGIKLGKKTTAVQSEASLRQLRDIELEKQQKIWQWLLAAALALLAIETIWGGLISRGPNGRTAESAP